MKNFFNQISRVWKGIYLIWFSIHLIILMIKRPHLNEKFYFYPFDGFDIRDYDSSEFLVYTFVTILIVLIIYYLKPQKDKKTKQEKLKGNDKIKHCCFECGIAVNERDELCPNCGAELTGTS